MKIRRFRIRFRGVAPRLRSVGLEPRRGPRPSDKEATPQTIGTAARHLVAFVAVVEATGNKLDFGMASLSCKKTCALIVAAAFAYAGARAAELTGIPAKSLTATPLRLRARKSDSKESMRRKLINFASMSAALNGHAVLRHAIGSWLKSVVVKSHATLPVPTATGGPSVRAL